MTTENMDFDLIASERTLAAIYSLEVRVEENALGALRSLRLKADLAPLARAKAAQAERAPCYVADIRIVGKVWRDMYDEHPGLGFYAVDAVETYEAPPYCTVAKAMEIALPIWDKAVAGDDDESDFCDGDFTADGIWLTDESGQILQCFQCETHGFKWLEAFPPEDNWRELEESARKLINEASEEERWDNFETGKTLRQKASSLRRIVQVAQLRHRHGH